MKSVFHTTITDGTSHHLNRKGLEGDYRPHRTPTAIHFSRKPLAVATKWRIQRWVDDSENMTPAAMLPVHSTCTSLLLGKAQALTRTRELLATLSGQAGSSVERDRAATKKQQTGLRWHQQTQLSGTTFGSLPRNKTLFFTFSSSSMYSLRTLNTN